jgi:galactose mutarotase-like enzyme
MKKISNVAWPFCKSLISSSGNKRVDTLEISGKKITPKSPQWSVSKRTMHGGKQEGVEIVVVNNGKLTFTIVPTRGMSVLEARFGDVRLGWDSPVKEIVHPHHINLQSRGGLGWLEGFNEWVVRCGLESNGAPGTDRFNNNNGDEATMELTLHGKIANIPASEVEVVVDVVAPYRITIRGRVDERMMFGPRLELWTEISTVPGSNEIRIVDTVTNRGATEQEFELLYHANYGSPLLEASASFLAPVADVTPMNKRAAKFVKDYASFAEPTKGFVEQVYCFHPLADARGKTIIALANGKRDRAVSMTYAVKELPCLTLWKNTASESEGYVAGIEPGTNFPNHRSVERKLGRVPKLSAGESHRATIDYAVHVGAQDVGDVMKRIAAIQARQKPVIHRAPEKKD